ncbi:MAG: hydroxymethylbilane synthase, partial [Nitrospirae bacterium]|nr:hydroxymethylbilane synthase [Nitrospirota bacterium]
MDSIWIGTRGSKLALWQADWIKSNIKKQHPGLKVYLKIIHTSGDKILDVPLA